MKTEAQLLAEAAAAPGAVQTASGLVYQLLEDGVGAMPNEIDMVRVHYTGRLASTGQVFDSSVARGEPVEFSLLGVIKGWTEGLQLMRIGGKAKLTVPSHLGYGAQGTGPIPGGATLVFDVELIAIVKTP